MKSGSDVLAEQLAYYRAVADEYERHGIDVPGQAELLSAISSFRPAGDVLELGRGERLWNSHDELLGRYHCDRVLSPSGVTHLLFWRR